jgi:hypothetical protein
VAHIYNTNTWKAEAEGLSSRLAWATKQDTVSKTNE